MHQNSSGKTGGTITENRVTAQAVLTAATAGRMLVLLAWLLCLFSVSGCSPATATESSEQPPPYRFVRVDDQTLRFEGEITGTTFDEYQRTVDDKVRVLVVKSGGGDTFSGVRMGLDIHRRGLKVVVDTIAGSSAANYLFLAGKEKVIQNGFVGFHGNVRAGFNQRFGGRYDALCRFLEETNPPGTVDCQTAIRRNEEMLRLEEQFLKEVGVPQTFFDLTQEAGKGLRPELDEKFAFLLPSPSTMKKFSITNVTGEQNISIAERHLKVIYW